MKFVFESESGAIKVGYNEKHEFVLIELHDEILHSDYVEGCERALKILEDKDFVRILFDNRNLKVVSNRSRAWVVRSMLPRMYSPKMQIAIINSKAFSSQLAVETIREVSEQMGYEFHQVKAFDLIEDGIEYFANLNAKE